MTQFTRLSLAVEHNGKPYFVVIPQEHWEILLHMVSGISDNGALQLVSAPEGYKFEALNKTKGQS